MSEPKSWDEVNGTKHINAADLLAAVEAERDALSEQVQDLLADIPCACGYDNPDDVCMKHYPLFRKLRAEREALQAENERLREADARLREWLIHERGLCEATGDKAGWIAYQRALVKRGQLERDRLAKRGGSDD